MGQTFGATTVEGLGLRNYVVIFTGIITFFVSFWYVRYKEFNFESITKKVEPGRTIFGYGSFGLGNGRGFYRMVDGVFTNVCRLTQKANY